MTELSRVLAVERLPAAVTVEADAAERAALARRYNIPAVERLSCRLTLRRSRDTVFAEGDLRAEVVQTCVVSLDPVAQSVREVFTVRFVPEGEEIGDEDPESPDELPYAGTTIDVGEAVAEQLALALDPYPRRPDAVMDPSADAEGLGAFAALAGLRRPR